VSRRVLRRLAATLAMVVLSTVAGLALVELAARSLGCVTRTGGGLNVRDRRFGWGNRADVDTTVRRCVAQTLEFESRVRTNRWGLRGGDVAERPAPGMFRILVLGDSFTHAAQVDDEATFTARLADRLAASGVRAEVLNAGVNGWGTDNAVLYYEQEGYRFEPDLVLLAFDTTNDVYENSRRMLSMRALYADKPYFTLEDGRLERRNFPLPPERDRTTWARAVVGRLMLASQAFSLLSQWPPVLRLLTLPPAIRDAHGVLAEPPEVLLRTYPEHWREAWRVTRGLVLRLRRALESRGARFAVVVISAKEEVAPARLANSRVVFPSLAKADLDPDKPHRLITSFLSRRGIPTVSLLAPFRERFGADGTPGFFRVDIHWSPVGHALAADVVAERLTAMGLVPQ
jgi:hypothetical protein